MTLPPTISTDAEPSTCSWSWTSCLQTPICSLVASLTKAAEPAMHSWNLAAAWYRPASAALFSKSDGAPALSVSLSPRTSVSKAETTSNFPAALSILTWSICFSCSLSRLEVIHLFSSLSAVSRSPSAFSRWPLISAFSALALSNCSFRNLILFQVASSSFARSLLISASFAEAWYACSLRP